MRRRQFLGGAAGLGAGRGTDGGRCRRWDRRLRCAIARSCGPGAAGRQARAAFRGYGSKVKITNVKVFGVSLTPNSDRPYVFVKLETDAGTDGLGRRHAGRQGGATMACVNDFRDFLIGADPMQSEHHWQSMYVHSFYRAGPVIGSAISGIDQALVGPAEARSWACPCTNCWADRTIRPACAATTRPAGEPWRNCASCGKRPSARDHLFQGRPSGLLRVDRDQRQN